MGTKLKGVDDNGERDAECPHDGAEELQSGMVRRY